MAQDPYFGRPEISNSDLSALQELLHPKPQLGDKEYAYAFGTLLDNLITEPENKSPEFMFEMEFIWVY